MRKKNPIPPLLRGITSSKEYEQALLTVNKLNLDSGSSLTMKSILDRAGDLVGKPVYVEVVTDDRLQSLTGLWLDTEKAGYIFYRDKDPFTYQIHSIFHELGHVLDDNGNCEIVKSINTSLTSFTLGGEIKKAAARKALDDDGERFAELMAYLLTQKILDSVSPEELALG